jgi:hypothetical protein
MDFSRRAFLGTGVAAVSAAQVAAQDNRDELRALVSQGDLVYEKPVSRSEEGIPIGNGRMGTLVWTAPTSLRFQINRVDVYANNSATNSFIERPMITAEAAASSTSSSAAKYFRSLVSASTSPSMTAC